MTESINNRHFKNRLHELLRPYFSTWRISFSNQVRIVEEITEILAYKLKKYYGKENP